MSGSAGKQAGATERGGVSQIALLALAAIAVPLLGWAFWALVLRLGSNDFHDYWLAGRLVLEGHSPYDVGALRELAAAGAPQPAGRWRVLLPSALRPGHGPLRGASVRRGARRVQLALSGGLRPGGRRLDRLGSRSIARSRSKATRAGPGSRALSAGLRNRRERPGQPDSHSASRPGDGVCARGDATASPLLGRPDDRAGGDRQARARRRARSLRTRAATRRGRRPPRRSLRSPRGRNCVVPWAASGSGGPGFAAGRRQLLHEPVDQRLRFQAGAVERAAPPRSGITASIRES